MESEIRKAGYTISPSVPIQKKRKLEKYPESGFRERKRRQCDDGKDVEIDDRQSDDCVHDGVAWGSEGQHQLLGANDGDPALMSGALQEIEGAVDEAYAVMKTGDSSDDWSRGGEVIGSE